MKIPEGLDPKMKEILARHLPPENPVIEGEMGHLETVPMETVASSPQKSSSMKKPWLSFIERSLPPGDRD